MATKDPPQPGPVRLAPGADHIDRDKYRRAADDIIAASAGVKLDGLSIKQLIKEGRP